MMEEIISTYYYNNGPCMEETGRFGWYIKEEPKFKEDLGKTAQQEICNRNTAQYIDRHNLAMDRDKFQRNMFGWLVLETVA